MKKIFTILGIVAVAGVANAQNLITNSGFENGLTGWSATNPGSGTAYFLPAITTTDPHAGSNAVEYVSPAATTGFEQNISVTPGTTYTISFWYKATGDNTDARIWANYFDSANTIIYQNSNTSSDPLRGPNNGYLPTSAVWSQYTTTVTSPSSVASLRLQVRAYSGSNVSFDDFSVTTGNLSVTDFSKSKYSLVKNTVVKEDIFFGKDINDVKIYNMLGQVLKTTSVKANETVNVADLPKGSYLVTGTVNNQPVSQKILKD